MVIIKMKQWHTEQDLYDQEEVILEDYGLERISYEDAIDLLVYLGYTLDDAIYKLE